jgi:hypothetical protein
VPAEGIIGTARRARRAVHARTQLRVCGWWGGAAMFAIGLAFAVEGVWAVAVPLLVVDVVEMWFVGRWVLPWTQDAYMHRLSRVAREWSVDGQFAYGQYVLRQAKLAEHLAELSPPPELAAEHERLIALVREADSLRNAPRSLSWAGEMAAAQQSVRQAVAELSGDASGHQQPYIAAISRLFSQSRDDYATNAAASERATADALQKLGHARVPVSVTLEHDALCAALANHLDVARASHEALRDPDRLVDAATDWDASTAAISAAHRRVCDRLDFSDRWPAPAATSHAPRQRAH